MALPTARSGSSPAGLPEGAAPCSFSGRSAEGRAGAEEPEARRLRGKQKTTGGEEERAGRTESGVDKRETTAHREPGY